MRKSQLSETELIAEVCKFERLTTHLKPVPHGIFMDHLFVIIMMLFFITFLSRKSFFKRYATLWFQIFKRFNFLFFLWIGFEP